MSNKHVIKNENDAFNILEKYSEGKLNADTIELEGWPILTIKLKGKKFDQSLTAPAMKGLVELQSAINRSYAMATYGTNNTNRLTDDERQKLEIVVKVEKSSSLLSIDLQEIITATLTKAISTMDAKTLAVTVVSLGLIWAGKTTYTTFLNNRKQIKLQEAKTEADREQLEAMKFMNAEETKRAEIFSKIVHDNSLLASSLVHSVEAQNHLLRAITSTDYAEVNGVRVTAETASQLSSNARRESHEVRLDGTYRILRNDTSDPLSFKVKIRNTETHQELDAIVQDITLNDRSKALLQQAEWNRTPVILSINAKSLAGEIKNAVIVSIREIEPT